MALLTLSWTVSTPAVLSILGCFAAAGHEEGGPAVPHHPPPGARKAVASVAVGRSQPAAAPGAADTAGGGLAWMGCRAGLVPRMHPLPICGSRCT